MDITGAQLITRFLEQRGAPFVAGIPGGAVLPLYRALADSSLRHVLARNEQGAAFIAQGYARVAGRAGVCIATSGPGVTNTVTALADAKADSVPLVCLAGQVPRALRNTDAFQELPTGFIVDRITKAHFEVNAAAELIDLLPEAFRIAESGRPGPVLLDLPKDVQTERVHLHELPLASSATALQTPCSNALDRAAGMIRAAQRPLFYFGGGVRLARASSDARRLVDDTGVPAVTSLMALGVLPPAHPLNLGMLGMHGAPYANHAVEACDLLIAVGARFDDRATGKLTGFARDAQVIHIDADPRELGKLRRPDLAVHADAGAALRALGALLVKQDRSAWQAQVAGLRRAHPAPAASGDDLSCPPILIRQLSRLAGPHRIVTTDVGQHQMWVAQHYPLTAAENWLTSGGLGTMGFGIPAAIGAALACPAAGALCITGDGSLLMNVQELATLADTEADVKIVVFDNGGLGMVRQQQSLFYQRHHTGSVYSRGTAICALARAFGVPALDLEQASHPLATLRDVFVQPGPMLVRAPIQHAEMVLPMVAPGAANTEMILEVTA